MAKHLLVALYVISAVFLIMFLISLCLDDFCTISPLNKLGNYTIYKNECVPRAKVTSFIVSDKIILLHYDSVGLVNIYDSDGAFIYGIQVGMIKNGQGGIYFDQNSNELFVKAKGNVIYRFIGSELLSYCEYACNPTEYEIFEKRMDFKYNSSYLLDNCEYSFDNEANQLIKSSEVSEKEIVLSLASKSPISRVLGVVFVLFFVAALEYHRRMK